MTVVIRKNTTNGQRNISYLSGKAAGLSKPKVKSLLIKSTKVTGRSSQGRITIRHRGGGAYSKHRPIDFNGRDKLNIPGVITSIEYDPKRTCFIALVTYKDGDKRYLLAHKGIKKGQSIITSLEAKAENGNRTILKNIPIGFPLFNLEITPKKGGQAIRSAGQAGKLISLDGNKAQVRMPSGEIRLVEKDNFATIGVASNEEHSFVRIGKAGRKRHMGRRPQVLGKSMNPCDHPHGGGEGHSPIGMTYPKTPWGAHALGVKTRKNKKTDRLILQSRHRAKK